MPINLLLLLLISWLPVAAEEEAPALGYRTFNLQYNSAASIQQSLTPLLQEDEQLSAHQRTLILYANPERIKQISTLIKQLDHPPTQYQVTVWQGIGDSQWQRLSQQNRQRFSSLDRQTQNSVIRRQTSSKHPGKRYQISVLENHIAHLSQAIQQQHISSISVGSEQTGVSYDEHTLSDQLYIRVRQLDNEYVLIDISQGKSQPGITALSQLDQGYTQVRALLGEWFLVSDSGQQHKQFGQRRFSTQAANSQGKVALRIEPINN